jgi:hypothetical protein
VLGAHFLLLKIPFGTGIKPISLIMGLFNVFWKKEFLHRESTTKYLEKGERILIAKNAKTIAAMLCVLCGEKRPDNRAKKTFINIP